MNREALQRLHDKLVGAGPYEQDGPIPSERLEMHQWVADCGTAACAVGHAAMDPWFQKRGLFLECYLWGNYSPKYRDIHGEQAVCEFFELDESTMQYLFMASSYISEEPTTAEVAARISGLLR